MKKIKIKFKLKYLWSLVVIIPLLAVAVILSVNAFFSPKPIKYTNAQEGVSITVTLDYNGATSGYNYTTKQCVSGEKMGNLPQPQKDGYVFNGWYCDDLLYTSETICRRDKDFTVTATWAKTFEEKFTHTVTFYSDNEYSGKETSYEVGEYNETEEEFGSVYVTNGYKLIAYPKKDFKGEPTVYVLNTPEIDSKIQSFKIEEIQSEAIQLGNLSSERKAEILKMYAPRIWMAEDEEFMPATLDESLKNQNRVLSSDGYILTQKLKKESEILDYFYGNVKLAKAYSFFVEKDGGVIDLVYFQYCPYNLGKKVLGRTYGNHIGDWEHITIRLKTYEENGVTFAKPTIAAVPTHSFKSYVAWDSLEKVEKTQHPVFYSALGSHGMWTTEGTHTYIKVLIVSLKDECSQGDAWDLWEDDNIETYSYDALNHTGEGIGSSIWNKCFDMDVLSPDSYAVWRWGNDRQKKRIEIYPVLDNGPTGPQFKKALMDYYAFD